MKKWILAALIAAALALSLTACGGGQESADAESVPDGGETVTESAPPPEPEPMPEPEPVSEPEAEPAEETPEPELTGKEKVDADLRAIVSEKYRDTRVTEITLNDNLGSEAEDDYVALIYLRWTVQNGPDMTKRMIAMYSEDFAARIGTDVPAVTDVAIFWTVPYYSEETAAKYSYERRDNGGMYKTDEVWTGVVR